MSVEAFHKIVVPIDGSKYSFRAASTGIGIAKKFGAELILVHVAAINQNLQMLGVYGTSHPESVASRIKAEGEDAASWFASIKDEASAQGVSAKSEVIDGPLSTVGEIVQYAEQRKVDLIVIGSRGRTGFKKLVLGSVASGVVTYAPCAVLVVK
ncbi:MAG: universal stress protein [Nitrososphaera sp.]|jgi:nucleotide-binding universal stress UspA family protein